MLKHPLSRIPVAAILTVGVAVAVWLALCDPSTSPAPRCILKAVTGWDCPGCGSQRAIHALLHGRVAEAWRLNAALFFAVPLCAGYLLGWRPLRRLAASRWTGPALVALILLWWVGRNVI